MVHVVDRVAALNVAAQANRAARKQCGLVALDNLESLLSDSGQWRDERWGF